MRIAIVGCGYVADHYLETLPNHPRLALQGVADLNLDRAKAVAKHYGTRVYPSTQDLLADPEVELVVNLTDPGSHYEVTRASLLAGKHVYSEKPLSVDLSEARELVELAEKQGLLLSGAPCSVLGETAQTLWKAVQDGAVGRVQLVYAEIDDNPVYLMRPEGWTSPTGAPWPYRNEFEVGCTMEHAGYYLTWLAAMFGPAESVTAFSSCLVPDKTPQPLDPPDTPDFSVACILFKSGVVARLTCSIVAPYDHRFRIIGDKGMLRTDECWQYEAPVYLERFSQLSLNARKSRSVRSSTFLQSLFGVGGKRQVLVESGTTADRDPSSRSRIRETIPAWSGRQDAGQARARVDGLLPGSRGDGRRDRREAEMPSSPRIRAACRRTHAGDTRGAQHRRAIPAHDVFRAAFADARHVGGKADLRPGNVGCPAKSHRGFHCPTTQTLTPTATWWMPHA